MRRGNDDPALTNAGIDELAVMRGLFDVSRLWRRPDPDRPLRRARPRILHRPCVRDRTDLRGAEREGQDVVFGSVGGGGRYDGLVSRFRSEPVPATGFSIGVSRLANALKLTGKLEPRSRLARSLSWCWIREQVPRYQEITSRAAQGRHPGRDVLWATPRIIGKQVSYADKRNAPAVIIEGSHGARAEVSSRSRTCSSGKEAGQGHQGQRRIQGRRGPASSSARGDLDTIVCPHFRVARRGGLPQGGASEDSVRELCRAGAAGRVADGDARHAAAAAARRAVFRPRGRGVRRKLLLTTTNNGLEYRLRPDFTLPIAQQLSRGRAGRRAVGLHLSRAGSSGRKARCRWSTSRPGWNCWASRTPTTRSTRC